jgi:hypothetical protein
MRYIKKYNLFKEDFEVGNTDAPDIKISKERMNTVMLQVKDYKQKKSLVDQLYTSTRDVKIIEEGLVKLLGSSDVKQGIDRNPFLVDYVNVVKLKTDIDNMTSDNTQDKLKLDDFQRDLITTTDPQMKQSLTTKVAEINKRMQERATKISNINIELSKSEKIHKDRMISIDKDIKEFNKKITNV